MGFLSGGKMVATNEQGENSDGSRRLLGVYRFGISWFALTGPTRTGLRPRGTRVGDGCSKTTLKLGHDAQGDRPRAAVKSGTIAPGTTDG